MDEATLPPEDVLALLKGVPFFEGLPEEDLARITPLVRQVRVEEGEVLFHEGDAGDLYYIVQEGAVELTLSPTDGATEKLAVRRRGEGFGEMALLADTPRSATARALEPTTLLAVERDSFLALLGRDPLAMRVLQSLSKALRALDLRFAALQRRGGMRGGGVDVHEMSRLIQRGLLPTDVPRIPGFDLAAGTNLQETGRGRTIWDHFRLRDGRTGLVALNVQGEGLPPAHYLSVARSLIREIARDHADLKGLLARVNSGLTAAVVPGMDQYVEGGILVPGEGGVEWAGAGRCPGAVIRRDGVLEEFTTHGPPLGMLEGFKYGTQRIDLGAGDAVIVLSEAPPGVFRGAADLVASLQGKPVGEVVITVHKALSKAQGEEAAEVSVLFVRKQ